MQTPLDNLVSFKVNNWVSQIEHDTNHNVQYNDNMTISQLNTQMTIYKYYMSVQYNKQISFKVLNLFK